MIWAAMWLLPALAAGAQQAPSAVGRISYGAAPAIGAAICTGTLVAPDLVLTAGHCLRRQQGNPAVVRFAAGLNGGDSLALRRGAEVILTPGPVAEDLSNDVALLRLDQPIAAEVLAPVPLAEDDPPPPPDRFTLFAYRRDAPGRAHRNDACALVIAAPDALALSCPVVSGNSGAPVLAWDGAGWRIAAVMVAATSGGVAKSLAARIPAALRARIAAP